MKRRIYEVGLQDADNADVIWIASYIEPLSTGEHYVKELDEEIDENAPGVDIIV